MKDDGCILVDSVDIRQLPLHVLRSKITVIPQEPVLFSGTIRDNLDPFNEMDDETLWNALKHVRNYSIGKIIALVFHFQLFKTNSHYGKKFQ